MIPPVLPLQARSAARLVLGTLDFVSSTDRTQEVKQ